MPAFGENEIFNENHLMKSQQRKAMFPPWWQSRRSQLLSPHKYQHWDSYPGTKTALGELWSPLKKLQQHGGKKQLENKLHKNSFIFACIIPSPKPAPLSNERELASWRVTLTRKWRAGWAARFPSLSRYQTKKSIMVLFQLEIGRAQMNRGSKERGWKAGANSIHTAEVNVVPSEQICSQP